MNARMVSEELCVGRLASARGEHVLLERAVTCSTRNPFSSTVSQGYDESNFTKGAAVLGRICWRRRPHRQDHETAATATPIVDGPTFARRHHPPTAADSAG